MAQRKATTLVSPAGREVTVTDPAAVNDLMYAGGYKVKQDKPKQQSKQSSSGGEQSSSGEAKQ